MKTQLSYPSAHRGDTIVAQLWQDPASPPRAVIQLVHGMCEYVNRYEELAQYLLEQGFAVCGEDHLGHGRSVGKHGYGYFARERGWDLMVEDTHQLTRLMRERFAGTPYFLLGHSMGSFLSRVYVTRYGKELNGLLLSGTGGSVQGVRAMLSVVGVMKALYGPFYRSKALTNLVFRGYNSRCEDRRTDKDWLSRDREVVRRYCADPMCRFLFTLSGYEDLLTLIGLTSAPEWAKQVPKTLPVYLYSGDQDPVGNYGEGVREVYDRLRRAGVEDVSLKLYCQGRHEMHNERNRQQVYRDMVAWLERHGV